MYKTQSCLLCFLFGFVLLSVLVYNVQQSCLLIVADSVFSVFVEQCSFVEHRNYKIIYRRYASLFFLVGVDNDEVSSILSLYFLFYYYQLVLSF